VRYAQEKRKRGFFITVKTVLPLQVLWGNLVKTFSESTEQLLQSAGVPAGSKWQDRPIVQDELAVPIGNT
jgi:hypothetical protein